MLLRGAASCSRSMGATVSTRRSRRLLGSMAEVIRSQGEFVLPPPVTFEDISTAMFRIKSGIARTQCPESHYFSELCGTKIFLKQEFNQFTGSFKERGARNALLLLTAEEKKRGVMAASAGNHALALAYHGTQLGIPVTVFMPEIAPLTKVERCRKIGAKVVIVGQHIGEAKQFALSSPEYEGVKYINGYDDPEIIAGAGTIGLIAGVGLAIKTLRPQCKVIGVEPAHCASFQEALRAGEPVLSKVSSTLADGLAVPMVGPTAFEVARRYIDDVVTVDEKTLAIGMLRLLENERCVVEGGGAAGLSAVLPGGPLDIPELKGKNVVVLLCGGNVDITMVSRVIDRGLSADKRLIRFIATVSDRPGGLSRLTQTIAEAGASIKDIHHERAWLYSSVDQVDNKCIVETTGPEHTEALKQKLLKEGYPLQWGVTAAGMQPVTPKDEDA